MKHWNSKFLEQLLQVQDTDLKIRELEQEKQSYHQKSKEEDGELSRLKTKIAAVDETLVTSQSQYQMYFTTLEDIRTAIKGLLTTKSGTPKPRTRSSTEALKIEEEKLSTLVDETALQLQRLKEERIALVGKAETRTVDLERTEDGPEAEIKKLDIKIRRLEKQREEEVAGLPPLLLKHYDRLRGSRSGIGLTTLRDGVCMTCRMQMPTAVISRMTKGERVTSCPACGRMVARIEIIELSKSEAANDSKESAKKSDIKAGLHRSRLKAKRALAEREVAMASTKEAVTRPQAPPLEKAEEKKTAEKKHRPKLPAEAPIASKPSAEEAQVKKEVAQKPEAKKKGAKKSEEKTPPKQGASVKKSPVKAAPSQKPAVKKSSKKGKALKPKGKKAPAKKPVTKKSGAKDAETKKSSTKKTPVKGRASKKKK